MEVSKGVSIGDRFGRLVVIEDDGTKASNGSTSWICKCDCGNTHRAVTGNLKSGSTRSCGCLHRELSIARRKAAAKPLVRCKVDGCVNTIEKGGHGFCGMHYMRNKRYGDVEHITSHEEWRKKCHDGQPTTGKCKPTTYKKNCGRHEHRAIMESILGRKLLSRELVHHIDGDQHNNDPSNLKLVSHSEHAKIHFTKKVAP